MNFEERERFLFPILKEASKKFTFSVIGGYAINAYVLPRFSVDCDVVIQDKRAAAAFQRFLEKKGFKERTRGFTTNYQGNFISMKSTKPKATFDLLVGSVEDRQSGIIIPASFVLQYSSNRTIYAKACPDSVNALVADPELLFLMKTAPARTTDIRDIFMLSSIRLNRKELHLLSKKLKIPRDRIDKVVSAIESRDFKDSLQSIYGRLPEDQFNKTKQKALKLLQTLR